MGLLINRISRILEKIKEHEHDALPDLVAADVHQRLSALEALRRSVAGLATLQGICYFFLYISVFSAFGQTLLGDAWAYLIYVSSFIGSLLFIVGIIVCNRVIQISVSDAHTHAAYIISQYVKYQDVTVVAAINKDV